MSHFEMFVTVAPAGQNTSTFQTTEIRTFSQNTMIFGKERQHSHKVIVKWCVLWIIVVVVFLSSFNIFRNVIVIVFCEMLFLGNCSENAFAASCLGWVCYVQAFHSGHSTVLLCFDPQGPPYLMLEISHGNTVESALPDSQMTHLSQRIGMATAWWCRARCEV